MVNIVRITANIPHESAPAISSWRKTGDMSGGRLNTPSGYGVSPDTKPITDTMIMPKRIAPLIFLSSITDIRMNPKTASITPGLLRSPTCTGAPSVPSSTILEFTRPTNVMKRPIPAAKLYFRFSGTASHIMVLPLATVRIVSRIPLIKTAPSAVCQE